MAFIPQPVESFPGTEMDDLPLKPDCAPTVVEQFAVLLYPPHAANDHLLQ